MATTLPSESLRPEHLVLPITERVLPRGRLRWLAIAAWSSIPFVRLAIFGPLVAGAGLVSAPGVVIEEHFAGAVLNAYVILIVLLGIRPVTYRLVQVAALGDDQTARVARLNGSTVG